MNATFVHELERLVVAQICNCFETVNLAAADALAEVLSRFLLEVGHTSHRFAETAGRTDVNASDVLCALSSLGSAFSRVIQDAEAFEIPFAHTLPLRLQIRRLAKVSSEACFFLTSKWSETHTCSLETHLCCRRIESACFS